MSLTVILCVVICAVDLKNLLHLWRENKTLIVMMNSQSDIMRVSSCIKGYLFYKHFLLYWLKLCSHPNSNQ